MITFKDHYTTEDSAFRSIEWLFRSIHDANVKIEEVTVELEHGIKKQEKEIMKFKELISELKRIEAAIQDNLNVRDVNGIRDLMRMLDEWMNEKACW